MSHSLSIPLKAGVQNGVGGIQTAKLRVGVRFRYPSALTYYVSEPSGPRPGQPGLSDESGALSEKSESLSPGQPGRYPSSRNHFARAAWPVRAVGTTIRRVGITIRPAGITNRHLAPPSPRKVDGLPVPPLGGGGAQPSIRRGLGHDIVFKIMGL
jgi:hypothetical protein